MKNSINLSVEEAIKAIMQLKSSEALNFIQLCAEMITKCFVNGKKIIIAGNGGSLCDAMHFAEEFSGFFREKRKALPAMVLSDQGLLTCVSNDVGYDYVFSRGIEAFGKTGDIFIALTTSGNSQNIINAVRSAKHLKLETIAFLGKSGGKLKGQADLEWIVKGFKTSDRIQEVHMAAAHIIIEMVEKLLLKQNFLKAKNVLTETLNLSIKN